jgi:hypothetical protein
MVSPPTGSKAWLTCGWCPNRGRYLAPYARIWLANADIREKNFTDARQLLIKLRDEFPGNPLFTQELARLDTRGR